MEFSHSRFAQKDPQTLLLKHRVLLGDQSSSAERGKENVLHRTRVICAKNS